MTCDEFRERLHRVCDERMAMDQALADHAAGCASCARFSRELLALDGALRALPREPLSPSVLASIRDTGMRAPPLTWWPDCRRATAIIVPGILLWAARPLLPLHLQPFVLAGIAFAGAFFFVTAVLRPLLLGPSV